LLSDAFSGNVRGAGPGVAETEIFERPSEPFIVFAADKTSPGAWNLPLYSYHWFRGRKARNARRARP
jgi:fructose 1,6-bisphosphate aldolase/phosphatase